MMQISIKFIYFVFVIAKNLTRRQLVQKNIPVISVTEKTLAEAPPVFPAEKSVRIYPNPNNGRFILELKNFEGQAEVWVYNTLGTIVFMQKITNSSNPEINLPSSNKGIYFVRVISGKEQLTNKLIVR